MSEQPADIENQKVKVVREEQKDTDADGEGAGDGAHDEFTQDQAILDLIRKQAQQRKELFEKQQQKLKQMRRQ